MCLLNANGYITQTLECVMKLQCGTIQDEWDCHQSIANIPERFSFTKYAQPLICSAQPVHTEARIFQQQSFKQNSNQWPMNHPISNPTKNSH
jgi:hypothetical protein